MSVTAIQATSQALRNVLLNNMVTPGVEVIFWTPGEDIPSTSPDANGSRINLFLYHVVESPHFKNDEWEAVSPQILHPPPLTLTLSYLLIPYSNQGNDNLEAHLLLGDAMRVFHEHPVIEPAYLPPAIRSSVEQVRIIFQPLSMDEFGKIWGSIESGPRLSVGYEVSVAQIASTLPERRISRVREIMLTTYPVGGPPRIEGITPETGPIGTTVTLTGSNFDGRYIELVIDGQIIGAPTVVSSSTLTFPIPAGLEGGYHQLSLIVNGRRSNGVNFVVTPYLEIVTPRQGPSNVATNVQLVGQGITTNFDHINLYAPDGSSSIPAPSSPPSNDEILFQIPSGADEGGHEISVSDSAGNESNREPFFVTPYIATLEPPEGGEGTRITIHGRGLSGTSIEVTISTISSGIVTVPALSGASDTTVEFEVPAVVSAPEYDVFVTVDGRQSNQLPFRFIRLSP